MANTIPNSTPKTTKSELLAKLPVIDRAKYPLIIIGVRGYYLDSMGEVGKNDIGIYDDAIMIDSPNVFAAFNGNTDPSIKRDGIATLKAGVYYAHKIGLHKGYQALSQQMGEVTVFRHNKAGEFKGYFGINIHRGGINTTSSEGCQTIYKPQWDSFIALVVSEAKRLYGAKWDKVTIPYVLL